MFNNKKIEKLENHIKLLEARQEDFIKHINIILTNLISESKEKYVWELRKEEIEMIENGKKFIKIRKILD